MSVEISFSVRPIDLRRSVKLESFILSRSLAKVLSIRPPRELLPFLENPPLVGDEKLEDYYNLVVAIVPAAKPIDAIHWLYIQTVVDTTWDIQREKRVKAGIIEFHLKELVLDLLKTTMEAPHAVEAHAYRIFSAAGDAARWTADSRSRKEIEAKLAARGYPPSELMARAYMKGESQIDAVDRRIATLEARRMIALREIDRRNEKLARHLDKASSDIIDADYSEAAE